MTDQVGKRTGLRLDLIRSFPHIEVLASLYCGDCPPEFWAWAKQCLLEWVDKNLQDRTLTDHAHNAFLFALRDDVLTEFSPRSRPNL